VDSFRNHSSTGGVLTIRTQTNQHKFQRVSAGRLPIYSAVCSEYSILYTPRLVCALNISELPAALNHIERLSSEASLDKRSDAPCSGIPNVAFRIVQAAWEAEREAAKALHREFTPECLTIYVNNRCNMRCRYCYSKPGADKDVKVSVEGVRSAARLIAEKCEAGNIPFTLAFHGGGEPTLDRRHVNRLLETATEEASRFGLHPQTYIATNAAVSAGTAHWLATRFDLVGVSCDGPPEIQDIQRPGRSGEALSGSVIRTMSILNKLRCPFHVRVTISRATVRRQAEIVSWLADWLPEAIMIEPVYVNRSGESPLERSHCTDFVEGFLDARAAGVARGIPISTSITRPDKLFGPYCNVLRNVLNLVPGDVATGCFLDSRPESVALRGSRTGALDLAGRIFWMDAELIRSLIARCSVQPVGCDDCLCSLQCTFGCPDRCALKPSWRSPVSEGGNESFRCLVNRMLMEHTILETADRAWNGAGREHCHETYDERTMLKVVVCANSKKDLAAF
jgi:uncharacterized protein